MKIYTDEMKLEIIKGALQQMVAKRPQDETLKVVSESIIKIIELED